MDVATTSRVEVGVRELKNHLSRYLGQVEAGTEVVVTDRGRPVARLTSIDPGPVDRLAALVERGIVRPPTETERRRPTPLRTKGPVSDLVADQRR